MRTKELTNAEYWSLATRLYNEHAAGAEHGCAGVEMSFVDDHVNVYCHCGEAMPLSGVDVAENARAQRDGALNQGSG